MYDSGGWAYIDQRGNVIFRYGKQRQSLPDEVRQFPKRIGPSEGMGPRASAGGSALVGAAKDSTAGRHQERSTAF
jgi:hypothetical protein